MTYEFFLLGAWQCRKNGVEAHIRPRMHELLALLLLYAHPFERLVAAAWLFPDLPESVARRRLRDALWRLRRDLPDLPLKQSRDALWLPPSSRFLDVEALQRILETDDAARWEQALRLYRGDLLPHLYAEWLEEPRRVLQHRFTRYLQLALSRHRENEQWDAVAPLARRLLDFDPYDESSLRVLMEAYVVQGRRGRALATYEAFASQLQRDLGMTPDVETQQWVLRIRRRSQSMVPASSKPPLQSRDLLNEAWNAFRKGDFDALRTHLQTLNRRGFDSPAHYRLRCEMAHLEDHLDQVATIIQQMPADHIQTVICRAGLLLSRHAHAEAKALVSRVLLSERVATSHPLHVELLQLWAEIEHAQDQSAEALKSIHKAMTLAERHAHWWELAQCLYTHARILFDHHRLGEADIAAGRLIEHARAHGYRLFEAWGLNLQGLALEAQGSYLAAQRRFEQSISLWRDIGLPMMEAYYTYNLVLLQLRLGQYEACLQHLNTVKPLFAHNEDRFGLALIQLARSLVLAYQNEAQIPEAQRLLESDVLPGFASESSVQWVISALAVKAELHILAGEYGRALQACKEAEAQGPTPRGEDKLFLTLFEGMARLGLGETQSAERLANRCMLALIQSATPKNAVAFIHFFMAQVQEQRGRRAEARASLQRAYESLLQEAAHLVDDEARRASFHYHPLSRRIMTEVYTRGIAELPQGAVIKRLPARAGSGEVWVNWTVDAGAGDAALLQARGEVALRRARVQRLLEQAKTQGAQPSARHLAEVLGVSVRTIQRDLNALART